MSGVFVTGTGTDIGKSVVTAGLLRALRRSGVDAAVMKPFQTGCPIDENGRRVIPDLEFALRVADWTPPEQERSDLCVYAYEPACSPHLAARMAGDTPALNCVLQAADRVMQRHDVVIAEGAGGLLVPINERQTMLDLMVALQWPVLLVARGGLGTINETLLSLAALRNAGLPCAGVILCDAKPIEHDFIYRDNPEAIADFGAVEVLGHVPFLGDPLADASWQTFTDSFSRPIAEWPLW